MSDEVKIRATSTLKLTTKGGASLTYTYPKTCPVDEIARDALFAVYMNRGIDGLQKFVDECKEKFQK